MGGVGKTALALALVERLAPRWPDGQFYVDLRGAGAEPPLTAAEAMRYVVVACEPGLRVAEERDQLAGMYRSMLHGRRALLLLDDALDAAQVEPLLPPRGALLIVTSRQRFTLPGLASTTLDVLPDADARRLVRSVAPRLGDRAASLVRVCSGLPLALRVAASTVAERVDLGVDEYLDRLAGTKARRELVQASIGLSYDLLAARSRRQWRLLAVFPATFTAAAAAAVWRVTRTEAADRLGELLRRNLVQWRPTGGRYELHDLVRLVADAHLTGRERSGAYRRHATHFQAVLSRAEQRYGSGGSGVGESLQTFDAEWGNIRAGRAWAAARGEQDEAAATLVEAYAAAAHRVVALRLPPQEMIDWFRPGVEAARRRGDQAREVECLGKLGRAHQAGGDYRQAKDLHRQRLDVCRSTGDAGGMADALRCLGDSHRSLGDLQRAIALYEQGLELQMKCDDRRAAVQTLIGLGNAHHELGELDTQVDRHRRALALAREVGDRRGQAHALGSLGTTHYSRGEARQAIALFEQAMVISRELQDRAGEAKSLGNLALSYIELGRYQAAVDLYDRSLAIVRGIGRRRDQAIGLFGKAVALHKLGAAQEAIECMAAARDLYVELDIRQDAAEAEEHLARWRRNQP